MSANGTSVLDVEEWIALRVPRAGKRVHDKILNICGCRPKSRWLLAFFEERNFKAALKRSNRSAKVSNETYSRHRLTCIKLFESSHEEYPIKSGDQRQTDDERYDDALDAREHSNEDVEDKQEKGENVK